MNPLRHHFLFDTVDISRLLSYGRMQEFRILLRQSVFYININLFHLIVYGAYFWAFKIILVFYLTDIPSH